MKYQSSNTKSIFDVEFTSKTNLCPECSSLRKKSKTKSCTYFTESNRAYCNHCNTTFFPYEPHAKKEYIIPEWKNKTQLSDKAVKWFESRMIKQETLNYMKVYSDAEWMPQFGKEVEVICFPFFANNKLVNIKFRGPNKSFKMVSGAQVIWYNLNAVLENKDIVIVEGEIDCLSLIQCGFKNCISVPNGASNFDFIDETIKIFEGKKIIIAVDNDSKGIELRDELIRRFGAENCLTVDFKQYKDANEYLIGMGAFELQEAIFHAKEVQVDGNISVDIIRPDIEDLFVNGMVPGKAVEMYDIDKFCTWETKRIAIATGRPGSGKSEFVDYLICRLNLLHGWKAAYFTPENFPLKYHYAKLFEKFIGKEFSSHKSDQIDFDIAYEYIQDNFFYILPEENLTIEKILANAKIYVRSKGIKILVIDPYNKLDHQIARNQTETQYISSFLDKLTMFAKLNDVLIFLVAHPTKLEKGAIPTLYDISGSAHFYNKTDYGFTIHRVFDNKNIMTNEIEVHWQKVKFKNLGQQGVSEMTYNYVNGRFEGRGAIDHWDNSNWLVKNTQTTIEPDENFWNEKPTNDLPF